MRRIYETLLMEHNVALVLFAVVICILASITANLLLERLGCRNGLRKYAWIAGSSLIAGGGVWSTHFISMLAYNPSDDHGFNVLYTALSLLIVLLFSASSFTLFAYSKSRILRIVAGGVLGIGIAMMHYSGMKGWMPNGTMVWDKQLVTISIIVGISLSMLSMEAHRWLPTVKAGILAGSILAIAICSLHFLGMSAMTVTHMDNSMVSAPGISRTVLAIIIGGVTLAIIQLGFTVGFFDFHMNERAQQLRSKLEHELELKHLQKVSKLKLVNTTGFYKRVLENIPVGIVIFDEEHKLVFSNKVYQDFAPFMASKIRGGMSLYEFVEGFYDAHTGVATEDPDIDALHISDKEAWIQQRMLLYQTSKEFDHKDDKRWVRVIDRRLEDGTFIGLRIDITEVKAHEAELLEAQKEAEVSTVAKSEFLATMSHEIRTPMNGILGMAQLLNQCKLGEEEKKFVDVILKSGDALMEIINDILDFSKIEAGHIELNSEPFSLRETIEDVITLLSPKAEAKGLDLRLSIDHNLPTFFVGDMGRVRQILVNIIGNAVKFTNKGHIFTRVTGTVKGKIVNLNIAIEDTGIGISEDLLDNIFRKFTQVDQSSTRHYEGTGLGLSIVEKTVVLMDGDVSVESELGKGSTFTINIPLPSHQHLTRTKKTIKKTKDLPFDISGMNVIVVDGNGRNLEILRKQFQTWNCRCITLSSGEKLLRMLGEIYRHDHKIDLILLNGQLPKINGEELLVSLKSSKMFKHIPVIMLTALDESNQAARHKSLGADGYLVKPISVTSLRTLISEVTSAIPNTEIPNTGDMENCCGLDGSADKPVPVEEKPVKTLEVEDESISDKLGEHTDSELLVLNPKKPTLDILVAEDNDINQLYMKCILEKLDITFKIVKDGQLAVDEYKNSVPRAILMDVSMPIKNGCEATREIRKLETISGTKTLIIGISAHAYKKDKDQCCEAGMDEYLTKPLCSETLVKLLKQRNIIQKDGRKQKIA